eukprot:11179416-Lingulodinium_polyedra.AAC.1
MIIARARELSPPPQHAWLRVLGFRPGHSCCAITDAVQEVLFHSEQYGAPIFFGVGDVLTAFDAISHQTVADALEFAGFPPPL